MRLALHSQRPSLLCLLSARVTGICRCTQLTPAFLLKSAAQLSGTKVWTERFEKETRGKREQGTVRLSSGSSCTSCLGVPKSLFLLWFLYWGPSKEADSCRRERVSLPCGPKKVAILGMTASSPRNPCFSPTSAPEGGGWDPDGRNTVPGWAALFLHPILPAPLSWCYGEGSSSLPTAHL